MPDCKKIWKVGVYIKSKHLGLYNTNLHVENRLRDYWGAVQYPNTIDDITARIDRQIPWSAAFITYIFSQCRITDNNIWRLSGLHYHYILQSIRNSQNNEMTNPFHGYRVSDYAPEIGDLVGRCSLYDPGQLGNNTIESIRQSCNRRPNPVCIRENQLYQHQNTNADFNPDLRTVIEFDDFNIRNPRNPLSKNSHVDIVVAKTDSHILVLGGNVELEIPQMSGTRVQPHQIDNRSVGIRRIYLDAEGKIDRTRRWEILDFTPSPDWVNWHSDPCLHSADLGEVMWDGPQTEYFVIIKVRTTN